MKKFMTYAPSQRLQNCAYIIKTLRSITLILAKTQSIAITQAGEPKIYIVL